MFNIYKQFTKDNETKNEDVQKRGDNFCDVQVINMQNQCKRPAALCAETHEEN